MIDDAVADDSATLDDPLIRGWLQNDRKTPLPPGTACFLTNLQGSFTSNDYSDGVFLSISNTGVWTLAASNAKSATVMCVR